MRKVGSLVVAAFVISACGGAAVSTPGTAAPSGTVGPPTATTPASSQPARLPGEASVVPPGTYTIDPNFGMTIDVPAGWATCCMGVITKNDFAGILYGDISNVVVYADSCHWKSGGQSQPQGATAFAAAFAAQVPRNASAPKAVTVGGMPSVHVRVTVPAEQDMDANGNFVGCDQGQFISWGSASDPLDGRYHQAPGQIDDLYLLDIDGRTYVFDVISGPDISASDKADLEAMLASLKIG